MRIVIQAEPYEMPDILHMLSDNGIDADLYVGGDASYTVQDNAIWVEPDDVYPALNIIRTMGYATDADGVDLEARDAAIMAELMQPSDEDEDNPPSQAQGGG